jgi:C_GCAxxG_C_C family probable redox protein
MAVSDLLDIDSRDLFRISEAFGGGVGGMGEICGAVSAMAMAAGLVNCSGDMENNISKMETIDIVNEMGMKFKESMVHCYVVICGEKNVRLKTLRM